LSVFFGVKNSAHQYRSNVKWRRLILGHSVDTRQADTVFPIRRNPLCRKNRTPYLQSHF